MAARDVGGTAPVCPFQIMASGGHALACASGTGQPASEAKGPRPVGTTDTGTADLSDLAAPRQGNMRHTHADLGS